MKTREFNFQRFAEEMADNSQLATDNAVAEGTEVSEAGPVAEDIEESFDDLIKGKYKSEYNAHVKEAINKRFKNKEDHEAYVAKLNPLLEALGRKHGLDVSDMSKFDVDALTKAVLDDNSLYEEEAFARGMDVETLKTMKQLEADNARYRQAEANQEKERADREAWGKIVQQAEEVKQLYPSFDLDDEMMNNEQFGRLVALNIPVKTAYQVCHQDEIMANGMAYAVQKTATQVSNNIKARGARPAEGALSNQAAASASIDPSKLTKEQYQDIRRRAEKGEHITFM